MSEGIPQKEILDWSIQDLSETERNNLLGFFALLVKIDKRLNPHLYARHSNPDNTEGVV